MIHHSQAEALSVAALHKYIGDCQTQTPTDVCNALMKMVSVAGVLMWKTQGRMDAVARLQGTAAFISKLPALPERFVDNAACTAKGTPAKRIYLSGPMSGLPELNFPAFHAMAARLRAAGHEVVNPAELNPDPAADWNQCMRRDIAALCTCTTLALMPGWETSQGAQLELHIAHRIGLGIVMAEALTTSNESAL